MISSLVYFFSAIIVLLSSMMIFYNWKVNRNVVFLALFFLIFALESTLYVIFIFGGNRHLYTLLNIISPLFFVKAPLLFLFVRGIVMDKFYLKKTDWLHFIPFLVSVVSAFPFWMTSYDEKYRIATLVLRNYEAFRSFDFHSLYPPAWNNLVSAIQMLIYISASFVLMWKIKKQYSRLTGQLKFQHKYTNVRMGVLLSMCLVIVLVQIAVSVMFYFDFESTELRPFIFKALYLAIYAYFAIPVFIMMSPRFLYGLPHLETKHVSASQFEPAKKAEVKKQDIPVDLDVTDEAYFSELSQKIVDYIEMERPYLNPEFAIEDICEALNVPRNHVQYCLNVILNSGFTKLRNEKKIAFAQELLLDSTGIFSVDEISKMSGFVSRSNFYSVFKDVTGFSPVQWVKLNEHLKKPGSTD